MTSQTILATLQNAWGPPPIVPVAVVESLGLQGVGVSMVRCESHLLPFDTVETKDTQRTCWIRSNCRLCGRFIGLTIPFEVVDTTTYASADGSSRTVFVISPIDEEKVVDAMKRK